MEPKDIYLVLYNSACCAGWAVVWLLAVNSVIQKGLSDVPTALSEVYATPQLGDLLFYVQGAAMLEILHSVLGLVRSPAMVAFMQVSSRIVALVAVTYSVPAQSKWKTVMGASGRVGAMSAWPQILVKIYARSHAPLSSLDLMNHHSPVWCRSDDHLVGQC